MAKSVSVVISDLREMLNKSGKDAATLTWKKFYQVADRERMKDAFLEQLSKQAKESSLFVAYGNAVVLVAKDYDFSPV
ncbi:hypothetical protein ACOWPU_16395 [Pseudomonas aeruginosa]|uniref:hypothetical protein n=1 Tax=Pseudomonas TaxID=286 RepID=UPI000E6B1097|nr:MULTISPECIES: hypothetical protein [Pseudomonas]MBG4857836.1 hypothetical protein [Pseudomonas aeruginosa]MDP5857561.1 hypothetical protein [Pseudomonas aeruginosa]MDP5896294.1 hypothetical protein [Pseudomonas aeruginosa]RIZ44024.1 hypothetical protein CIK02_06225 [Pseudomonas putida]HBN7751051.1 hypothetical protein [Pseudomonas aeruginosa]